MKVTYNWLKDFVDISLSPSELADKLTMAGLEVESAEAKGGDTVFSIEVTSNRPDWLSVSGIAREISAITGKKLRMAARLQKAAGKEKPGIVIEEKKDCSLYTARVIRGIHVDQSPDWMRRRLELVGVRPVNNIVDITNYVLFERGEPLHAFDLDTLYLPVIVRRAAKGEKILAIDGKEYSLDPGVLVIADSRAPVAIAGVMGGKNTEVTGSTKNVLLEAAIFDPILVRRGRQKLGMQSEASYRFERGIDPASPEQASVRAAQLVQEIAGGAVTGAGSSGSAAEKARTIAVDPEKISGILGARIDAPAVKRILISLGFEVTAKGKKTLAAKVPSFRRDVKGAVDLVEEVARIYGYEKVPSRLPPMVMQPAQKSSFIPAVKDILIAQGLDEVLTYSLIDRKSIRDFYCGADLVEVVNPLSEEQEILRPVLMASLARCVGYNLNQRRQNCAIFEIAKTYTKPDREHAVLGIAVSGTFSRWLGFQAGTVQCKAGFLTLKGIIDELLSRLAIDTALRSYEYTGGASVSLRVKGKTAGTLKKLTGKEQELFDIKDKDVFLAEISLELLLPLARAEKIFKPFPRFPSISRDITLELGKEIPLEKILARARGSGGELLKAAEFLDYYDKNLPPSVKRITITCVYSAGDRTLTETEIAPVHGAVINALSSAFSARIR